MDQNNDALAEQVSQLLSGIAQLAEMFLKEIESGKIDVSHFEDFVKACTNTLNAITSVGQSPQLLRSTFYAIRLAANNFGLTENEAYVKFLEAYEQAQRDSLGN